MRWTRSSCSSRGAGHEPIRRYLIELSLLSSVFDSLTFGVLLALDHGAPESLRAGWFVESPPSQPLIAPVVRTLRPLWRRVPGRGLFISTAAVRAPTRAVETKRRSRRGVCP